MRSGVKAIQGCYVVTVVILWGLFCPPTAQGLPSGRPCWRVMILHGADILLPASIVVDQAIRDAFLAGANREIEFFSEDLDALRLPGARFETAFPVEPSPLAELVIDWRELRRWNMGENLLPPGSVIFITAHDKPIDRKRAKESGTIAYLSKPFQGRDLVAAVTMALGCSIPRTLPPFHPTEETGPAGNAS
jgi:hypothetical protein